MFKPDQLDLLRTFINACKAKPDLLHSDDLSFFKEWLLSLGATLPEDTPNSDEKLSEPEGPTCCDHDDDGDDDMPDLEEVKQDQKDEVESDNDTEEEIESDLELEELDGIIKEEEVGKLEMGEDGLEVTEEMMDESNCKRGEAMSHLSDGDIDAAIASFTEAIKKNPHSANMYAKRASALIRAGRPSAALQDCEKAISINKDSAQPYKWRGRAYRLLGKYVEAYHDFQTACRLDFDETCREWQKEVEPNAKKIMEHNRKYERLHKEREINKRIKEAKRRKAEAEKEYERARKEEQNKPQGGGFPGGFPGGMGGMPGGMPGGMGGMPGGMPGGMGGMPGGMGGMPGGMGGMPGGMPGGGAGGMPGGGGGGMPDLNALFSDPEIMTAMQDPEVMAAFQDVSKNPANMSKYEGNPKVKKVIEKLQSKFGGGKMPGAL